MRSHWLLVFACWNLAVFGQAETTTATAEPPVQAEAIPNLIVQLDDDRFAVRELASEQLANAGLPAVSPLRDTLLGSSLEAADRAEAILWKLARSESRRVQQAALETLAACPRFPSAQRRAESLLADLAERICTEEFIAAGADFQVQHPMLLGDGVVTKVRIVLGPKWSGSLETFAMLARLRGLHSVQLEGQPVDDELAMSLAMVGSLQRLELSNTRCTPVLVESLKRALPKLRIQMKNSARLGVVFLQWKQLEVDRVEPDSPAAAGGLQSGDILRQFAGRPVADFDLLTAHIAQHQPGSTVQIVIERSGQPQVLEVALGSW